MIYYRCKLCGRVFKERISHLCGKNFRKHHLEWEEIDDRDYEKILQDDIINGINWEQVRIETAIAALPYYQQVFKEGSEFIAKMAIKQADALVAELKKRKTKKIWEL